MERKILLAVTLLLALAIILPVPTAHAQPQEQTDPVCEALKAAKNFFHHNGSNTVVSASHFSLDVQSVLLQNGWSKTLAGDELIPPSGYDPQDPCPPGTSFAITSETWDIDHPISGTAIIVGIGGLLVLGGILLGSKRGALYPG